LALNRQGVGLNSLVIIKSKKKNEEGKERGTFKTPRATKKWGVQSCLRVGGLGAAQARRKGCAINA